MRADRSRYTIRQRTTGELDGLPDEPPCGSPLTTHVESLRKCDPLHPEVVIIAMTAGDERFYRQSSNRLRRESADLEPAPAIWVSPLNGVVVRGVSSTAQRLRAQEED